MILEAKPTVRTVPAILVFAVKLIFGVSCQRAPFVQGVVHLSLGSNRKLDIFLKLLSSVDLCDQPTSIKTMLLQLIHAS